MSLIYLLIGLAGVALMNPPKQNPLEVVQGKEDD
jgi:hypothetical protein